MALTPAITDLEQLKDRAVVADLLSWKANAVAGARFDRNELTVFVARESIREACRRLKAQGLADFLSDVTCADFIPVSRVLSWPTTCSPSNGRKGSGSKWFCPEMMPWLNPLLRFGRPPISLSVSCLTSLVCAFSAILISAASCCRKIGKAIPCARTIRWRAIVKWAI